MRALYSLAALVAAGLVVWGCGGEQAPPKGTIDAKVVVSGTAVEAVEVTASEAETIGSLANIQVSMKAKKDLPQPDIWIVYKTPDGTEGNVRADGPQTAGASFATEIRTAVTAEALSVEITEVLDTPKFLD